jgi:hypothetical protein
LASNTVMNLGVVTNCEVFDTQLSHNEALELPDINNLDLLFMRIKDFLLSRVVSNHQGLSELQDAQGDRSSKLLDVGFHTIFAQGKALAASQFRPSSGKNKPQPLKNTPGGAVLYRRCLGHGLAFPPATWS